MLDTKRSWAAGLMVLLLSLSTAPVLAQSAGSVFKDCPDCAEMVVIPAGSYLMGSKPDPVGNFQPPADETPQHSVTLKSFALGKYEVTQKQWRAVMGGNPSYNRGRTLPVERVSWNDVQKFIQKLNAKTGKHYRLPTESEWEYAARAGSTTRYSFGDEVAQLGRYAWFAYNSDETHPVGKKLPNKFGLYDMHGNVWEWVQDCYQENYIGAPVDGSAVVQQTACDRVSCRGGPWGGDAVNVRSAIRGVNSPETTSILTGFRLARTLP
jgi:formylglycine-generating enzyme required for sulfatase activity